MKNSEWSKKIIYKGRKKRKGKKYYKKEGASVKEIVGILSWKLKALRIVLKKCFFIWSGKKIHFHKKWLRTRKITKVDKKKD